MNNAIIGMVNGGIFTKDGFRWYPGQQSCGMSFKDWATEVTGRTLEERHELEMLQKYAIESQTDLSSLLCAELPASDAELGTFVASLKAKCYETADYNGEQFCSGLRAFIGSLTNEEIGALVRRRLLQVRGDWTKA